MMSVHEFFKIKIVSHFYYSNVISDTVKNSNLLFFPFNSFYANSCKLQFLNIACNFCPEIHRV